MYGHKALRVCTIHHSRAGHQSQAKELTLSHHCIYTEGVLGMAQRRSTALVSQPRALTDINTTGPQVHTHQLYYMQVESSVNYILSRSKVNSIQYIQLKLKNIYFVLRGRGKFWIHLYYGKKLNSPHTKPYIIVIVNPEQNSIADTNDHGLSFLHGEQAIYPTLSLTSPISQGYHCNQCRYVVMCKEHMHTCNKSCM